MEKATIDDFRKAFEDLQNYPTGQRSFIAYAGSKTTEKLDVAFKRNIIKSNLDTLRSNKLVNEQEFETITQMIDSPDMENLTVAEAICNHKLNESVSLPGEHQSFIQ